MGMWDSMYLITHIAKSAVCLHIGRIIHQHSLLLAEHLRQQRASGVALAAWEKIGRGESGNAASLVPHYLRLSQAERARLEKTKTE